MWVFRGHSKFRGPLMLYVLDVGFQRSQSVFLFSDVGCVRCGFSEGTSKFSGFLRLYVLDVGFQRV